MFSSGGSIPFLKAVCGVLFKGKVENKIVKPCKVYFEVYQLQTTIT